MSRYLTMNTTTDQIRSCRLDIFPGYLTYVKNPTPDTIEYALSKYVGSIILMSKPIEQKQNQMDLFKGLCVKSNLPMDNPRTILWFKYFHFPELSEILNEPWNGDVPARALEYLAIIKLLE